MDQKFITLCIYITYYYFTYHNYKISLPYIAGIFRGYKCSWFLRIRHEPQTFITANLILPASGVHACSKKALFHENLIRENLSKGISAKMYTLEIIIPAIRYSSEVVFCASVLKRFHAQK